MTNVYVADAVFQDEEAREHVRTGGALCPLCRLRRLDDAELCQHHEQATPDDWAMVNRLWCGFFHRGQEIPRLAPSDRDDAFWGSLNG